MPISIGYKEERLKNYLFIALSILYGLVLVYPESAWAQVIDWEDVGQFEKSGNEGLSGFFGYLALIFFIIANIYTPAKWVIKHNFIQDTQALKKNLPRLFNIHVQCNVVMFILAVIHAYNASQGNVFLVAAMLIFAWLIFGGTLMQSEIRLHKDLKKYLRILHAQQLLFGAAIILLVFGHVLLW